MATKGIPDSALRLATYSEAVEALTAVLMQDGVTGVRVHSRTVTVAREDCDGVATMATMHGMLLHDVCWFDAHDPISIESCTLMSLEPTMGARSPVVLVECRGDDSADELERREAAELRHNAQAALGATAALEARGVTMLHDIAGDAREANRRIRSLQSCLERLERARRDAFEQEATDARD